jgi:hypothetical protein
MSSQLRKEAWPSRNIYTQELNSRDLVTLEELCEILDIHPVSLVPSTHGGFNNTYFTHHKTSGQELAIRVSKEPVAVYTSYRGQTTQGYLRANSSGVNSSDIAKIQQKRKRDREKEGKRKRMQPNKTPQYEINSPDLPNYSSLHRQEIEDGEILIELARSKRNWLESSHQGLCPPIIYYGYIIEAVRLRGWGRVVDYEIRSCIISEKYSMDLGGFYVYIVMTAIYNEKERELINNKVLEEVRAMIRGLVELSIICADIKPANMVVKYNTRPNGKIDLASIKVRFIDLDGDWCKESEEEIVNNQILRRSLRIGSQHQEKERERKENIELLMLLVLGFHFDEYIEYNPFTAHFKDVFKQKKNSPEKLHEMLRKPTTIPLSKIDDKTDLSLLPLNKTYDHYFLNRDSRKQIIPDPDGEIFMELCEAIQEPYVPPSSATSLPVGSTVPVQSMSGRSQLDDLSDFSQFSRGGKKQRTLRYKMSKRKGGSTKRKTLKIRKI